MPESAVFDTRYFNEAFYNDSPSEKAWLRGVFTNTKRRLISAVTLHEIYGLTLRAEGREVAKIRCAIMERDFTVVPLDGELATTSAELRHGHGFSLADSVIAATATRERCAVVSDDSHFKEINGLKTIWMGD
jgi:predicted nucleic acid-binding protein